MKLIIIKSIVYKKQDLMVRFENKIYQHKIQTFIKGGVYLKTIKISYKRKKWMK